MSGTRDSLNADHELTHAGLVQNTYSTAIVIGEKAAVIVAEELGLALEPGPEQGLLSSIRAHL